MCPFVGVISFIPWWEDAVIPHYIYSPAFYMGYELLFNILQMIWKTRAIYYYPILHDTIWEQYCVSQEMESHQHKAN